jgi:hypothetical protein
VLDHFPFEKRMLRAVTGGVGIEPEAAIVRQAVHDQPSAGVQLLAVLGSMFTKNRTEVTSEQVVQELVADPDSPWQEYRGRGPITKNQVAALLRDYDIRPVVVHPTKRADFSRHGYRAAHFDNAFARFFPTSRTSEHSSAGARGLLTSRRRS